MIKKAASKINLKQLFLGLNLSKITKNLNINVKLKKN